MSNTDEALKVYGKQLLLSKQLKNKKLEACAFGSLGLSHRVAKQFDKSLGFHTQVSFVILYGWHQMCNPSKHPLLILGPTLSRYYNAIVGIIQSFFEQIFKHINCPLSGLIFITDKCRSEDQQGVLLVSPIRWPIFLHFAINIELMIQSILWPQYLDVPSWRCGHKTPHLESLLDATICSAYLSVFLQQLQTDITDVGDALAMLSSPT